MIVTSHNSNQIRASVPNLSHSKAQVSIKEDFLAQFFNAQGSLRPEYRRINYDDGG